MYDFGMQIVAIGSVSALLTIARALSIASPAPLSPAEAKTCWPVFPICLIDFSSSLIGIIIGTQHQLHCQRQLFSNCGLFFFQILPEGKGRFYSAIFHDWTDPVLFQCQNAVGRFFSQIGTKKETAVVEQNCLDIPIDIPAAHTPDYFIDIIVTPSE